jgi:hypothetical protein
MPRIPHQDNRRGTIAGNGLLAKPAAAPAILLWMQSQGRGISLPADDHRCAKPGLRAAILAAAVLFGGFALASVPPPATNAEVPKIELKTFSIEALEAEESKILRLAKSSSRTFDRESDLGEGFSDMPPITVLKEPMLDTAISSLPPLTETQVAPETQSVLLQPKFAQEFWRTIGQSRLSDAYAAYLGRYSWKTAEQPPVIDLDLAALARVDAEEMRRLDARRLEARLHVSLLEVPTPKRAPRAAAHRKPALSKTHRACRNRIWQCGPPISPVAQGSVQRLRSRPN